jgi:hypothetical protein
MVDRQLQNFEDPHRRMLDFLRHGMEPFASAGLSKPTGFNNTKPTWSHIEETDTPDDFDFSVAVAAGNDKAIRMKILQMLVLLTSLHLRFWCSC